MPTAIPSRIAFISTQLPRKCGIATFTAALHDGYPSVEQVAVALSESPGSDDYPPEVRFDLAQNDPVAYQGAAVALNDAAPSVVSLQHAFGIFGGEAGAYVLALMRHLQAPVVATLHSVLEGPTPAQHDALRAVAAHAHRVVVMSRRGASLLQSHYGLPADKIDHIPHGIPDPPSWSRRRTSAAFT